MTTATFAAGVEFVDMMFTIVADDDNEGVESFTVELQTPVGGVIAQPSVSTVFILEESGKYCMFEFKLIIRSMAKCNIEDDTFNFIQTVAEAFNIF